VLDRQPRSADAVCGERCLLLRLKAADLHELLAHRPAMQMQILLSLVARVRDVSQRAGLAAGQRLTILAATKENNPSTSPETRPTTGPVKAIASGP